MSKKSLHFSSAKLTAICFGLLLAVFCTIGMSFRPVYGEDEAEIVMNGPRHSHYWESGCFGDSEKDVADYAKTIAITRGNGSVRVTAGDATNVTATSEASGTNDGDQAYIEWNCGKSEDGHTKAITYTATRAAGYVFYGWSETNNIEEIVSTELSYTVNRTIPHGEREPSGTYSGNTEFESPSTPCEHKLYAFFTVIQPQEITFLSTSEGGIYDLTYNGNTTPVSSNITQTVEDAVTLTAHAAEGYVFAGWYQVDSEGNIKNLSSATPYEIVFSANVSVGAHFVRTTLPQFQIKETTANYYGLKAATMAAAPGQTIIPVADCAIDGSDLINANDSYTIPIGVTLLVPYSSANSVQTEPVRINETKNAKPISIYRKLTLKEGANIKCNGTICVGGQACAGNGGNPSGYVTDACGMIDMSAGGHIDVQNGGTLYCWGFVKGQDMDQGNNTQNVGTITANSGAVIWENFAIGDWRGGTFTGSIALGDSRFFPFQSYFIQNIEIPVTYKFGSTLKNFFTFNMGGGAQKTDFDLIGSDIALFKLTDDNSLVRKWYDPTTDLMCYELSGSAIIDHIELNVYGTDVNSEDFDLPINSNMHVILTKCDLTLNKPMVIQPSAVVEIKNDASVTLATNIYMYDKDEWGPWISSKYYRSYGGDYPILTSHKNRGDGTSNKDMDDAAFIVDGTLDITGNLYSSTGGANIMGNGGGKVTFSSSLPGASSVRWYKSTNQSGDGEVGNTAMYAANLCNEDGSYTRSVTSAVFHNVNGRWFVDGKQNEKADHTYDFTYIGDEDADEDGVMDDVNTLAVYSKDKTGLEERFKWANVTQDGSCSDNYNAANGIIYNYTKNNTWTQFIPDERPNGYSGSDNKLYTKDDCTFADPVAIDDETCLYPFTDGNKALVNGIFIALTPNDLDAAYRDADEKYYICFKGCNWHEATPYDGELKTYDVVEGGTYIWFENDWLNVERDEFAFYTTNDQNVKTYYEYKDGEWIVATPYVAVIDENETRELFSLPAAFTIASAKKNATIKVLRDFTNTTTPFTFTASNTTCTLDLNGHVADIVVEGAGTTAVNMITINATGSTFNITDNTTAQNGVLKIRASINTSSTNQVWRGINVTKGTLQIEKGTVYVENHFGTTGRVSGVGVAAGAKFTMKNGHLDVSARAYAYGVLGADGSGAVITVDDGKIDATTTNGQYAYGIRAFGTINVNGGTISASAKSNYGYGIFIDASTSNVGVLNLNGGTVNGTSKSTYGYGVYINAAAKSGKVGTLNMYAGSTVNGTATGTSYGIFVNRALDYNSGEPRTIKTQYPAKANIYGGTIKVITTNGTTAMGIATYGTVNISGGNFTVKPSSTTSFGVRIYAGTTTISGDAYFDVQATENAYGVRISEETPNSYGGAVYNGTLVMDGGTLKVKATAATKAAYGVFVGSGSLNQSIANDPSHNTYKSYYKGNYANAGTATINDGVIDVTAKTTNAYALFVRDVKTESRVEDKDPATATPKCTINGGKFKVTSTDNNSSIYAANNAAQAANFQINAGYFNKTNLNSGDLSKYIVSPKAAIALTNAEGNCPDENYPEYTHKVAEAYLITFMNGEDVLQSTMQNAGVAAVYNGLEPRKDDDGDNSYEFDGWATTADAESADADLSNVSAAATYYAHFATTAKKYIITWNANGGTCATELTRVDATGSETVGTLPAASKTGHDFDGWFTASEGGTQISASTVVTGHVTYYAYYSVHSHTLTWNANGGSISGDYTKGSVNYGATITAPANANVTRTGYTFAGWNATPTTTMPDNDLTYTAQWTANTNTAYQVLHKKQNLANFEEYTTEETQDLTGTTATWVTPETRSYEGYKTPASQTRQIAADGSLVVTYLYDCITYTIAFDATTNGGTCTQDPVTIVYGNTLGLEPMPTATKEGNDFVGWYTKAVGGDVITTASTFKYNVGTIYAQFRAKPKLVIGDEDAEPEADVVPINISNNSTVVTTTVHTNGQLNIDNGRTLTTTNLIIEATSDVSGEISGNVTATNAYFDLTLNAQRRHWKAFTVPFEVDLRQHPILADGVSMPLGVQYDIIYYDGAVRAAQGKVPACWRYVEDDANWILTPGVAYMIVFGLDVNTVRFTKKDGASVAYSGTVSVAENNGASDDVNGGWNGIGNPATYHALLSAGVTECQVHNGEEIGSDGYIACDMGKFIVGKAVFVQVEASQSVVVNPATSSDPQITAAPCRAKANATGKNRFDVQIAPVDGKMADRMFLLADEDKEDKYVILQDLAKAGLSTKRAQIWVDRYNTKLCKNTAVLMDGTAEYPLGIFAPQAGEYEIAVAERMDDQTSLYLTLDGGIIWNLSDAPYLAELEKGTTKRYGLKLVHSNTPAIATPIDNVHGGTQPTAQKIMLNGKVYILRGKNLYSVDGQLVK